MDIGDVFDKLGSVLLYAVIALIGGMIVVGGLVYFLKREKFSDFKKYAAGIAVGFALVTVIAMGYLKGLDTEYTGEGKSLLFWPVMAEIIIVVAGMLAVLISGLFSKKAAKIAGIVTGAGLLGGFIAIMVEMSKYFGDVKADYPGANLVGMAVSAVIFIMIIIGIYLIGAKRDITDTRSIVYGAIAIALSFALSYVKFFEMPQGGSVTFASLLPLMIYCCMFGTRRGVIMCLIYGALQAVQDPYIIHPMQFLLDYPLAFGVIGVSGWFVEKNLFKFKGGKIVAFLAGGILAVALRYACHVLSGVFAFADWADLDKYGTAAAYSLAYNSFAFIDMLIALVAGVLLLGSGSFVKQMERSADVRHGGESVEVHEIDDEDELDRIIAAQNNAETQNANETQTANETQSEEARPVVETDEPSDSSDEQ